MTNPEYVKMEAIQKRNPRLLVLSDRVLKLPGFAVMDPSLDNLNQGVMLAQIMEEQSAIHRTISVDENGLF